MKREDQINTITFCRMILHTSNSLGKASFCLLSIKRPNQQLILFGTLNESWKFKLGTLFRALTYAMYLAMVLT